jgi:hypothetical protein
MTRINALRSIAETRHSVTWGKHGSIAVFAAVLIICSVTVGCSNDKPKPVSANTQIPVTQSPSPVPAPVPAAPVQAANKPAPKKPVQHKQPATVNYTDMTSGVTFEYPRRYAIETGTAATELVASNPLPMNFVQPGGVALAAVELPETSFANTDFSSAFFNVSVHKTLSADQCAEFAVPQPKIVAPVPSSESASTQAQPTSTQTASTQPEPASTPEQLSAAKLSNASNSKLMVGGLELHGTEAVSGEGTRQSDSKYFHAFQNGACYEFALNVTTVASEDGITKHVDRDKVFDRLEKILATVKITPVSATPEVTAEAPAPATTPAQ